MATGSRPPKRPVVGSRSPTGRPRKVAGRRDAPSAPPRDAGDASVDEAVAEPEPAAEAPSDVDSSDLQAPTPAEERSGILDSPLFTSARSTVALVAVLVVLLGALGAGAWYVWGSDDVPVVSADRPVVTGEITQQAAVDAAAQSAQAILSYGYQDFDAQIDEATSKMTDPFAERFRETAAGVRQDFVENKIEQEMKILGQSVVQASPEKVQALVFMDQYVTKNGRATDVTPYRLLVTVVHTDGGWLVDNIDTE